MGYKYLVKMHREDGRNVLLIDPFTSGVPVCRVELGLEFSGGERALEPDERIMLFGDGDLRNWMKLFFIHSGLCEDSATEFAAELIRRLWRMSVRYNLGLPLFAGTQDGDRQ